MNDTPHSLYAAHVSEVQARWEAALEAENLSAALLHSGTPMHSFLDDYEYAFRPNPHFLHWLPLTRHADSALLIEPGRRPRLFYYQPDDYWYLPPADPESWWADHFDIEVVRDASGWLAGLERKLRPGSRDSVAAVGDAPGLTAFFRRSASTRRAWWTVCTSSAPARRPTRWPAWRPRRGWPRGPTWRPSRRSGPGNRSSASTCGTSLPASIPMRSCLQQHRCAEPARGRAALPGPRARRAGSGRAPS
jgi:hypothetical protein